MGEGPKGQGGHIAASPQTIHIAVMALGGQGGGVLIDWLVDLAEHAGWTAQATSVAGVAQRTGATIYYVEMVEPTPGRQPILALMPVPGDVDVVIAAELMEAGRAVERGLVTRERTLVIASTHRAYAVPEKSAPGNAIADSAAVHEAVQREARRLVADDFQALAVRHGSVISAALFGALAGSGALPFAREQFEAVVERSGIGVQASLAALRAGAQSAAAPAPGLPRDPMQTAPRALPERAGSPALQPLLERVRGQFPRAAWDWLGEGLARVVDWQDIAYGTEYLDQVARLARHDTPTHGHALTIEAARWIAVAMSYDDVIRVADLKTRGERAARVRAEVDASIDDVVGTEEYFHPRWPEVVGMLPRRPAEWLDNSPRIKAWLAPRLDHGRRIRTHTLRGHLQLRAVAGLRRWRRGNLRHAEEMAHLQAWLAAVERSLSSDYALAVELLRCRRLVKGYSDTHARGSGRFDRLLRAAALLAGRDDAGAALAALRTAALRDAEGDALDRALQAMRLAV
ncbi:MAG TPA: indolepyruvate oxidoreductase subunit beta family protein [Burkholderiaceae bacterium]|nr:indolepyruvate oxidoreductase subunit beta family protein [Burkholderiaceae bacterium]